MVEPRWTEVDGVPVAWAELPGPMRAGLHFRVGVANETAVTHGVTHLVEHLALHGMHHREQHVNGGTELTRTTFMTTGRPPEVSDFLRTVCRTLSSLPEHRVDTERRVLRNESAERGRSYRDLLLGWRFGNREHGLAAVHELGVRRLPYEAIDSWAATRFTRENALLVLSGPPPSDLRLPLRSGPRNPAVVARPLPLPLRGWDNVNAGGIAASAVVPRVPAAVLGSALLSKELNRVLRFERGLTYGVSLASERLDATTSHVLAVAEAGEETLPALVDAFVDTLERIEFDGADPGVVEPLRRQYREDCAHDRDRLAWAYLDSLGLSLSTDSAIEPYAEVESRYERATAEQVSEWLRTFVHSSLHAVAEGHRLSPHRYPRLPWWSGHVVNGRTFTSRHHDGRLVVGPEGVSLVDASNRPVTVRWAETAAALRWADGARQLAGIDGKDLIVVPWEWDGGPMVVDYVDRAVHPGLFVEMGVDSPWPAPQQPAPGQAPKPGLLGRVRGRRGA